MHAPLTTDRQRFYHLMSLICEDLPGTAVIDTMVRQGHQATVEHLRAVRNARKVHLPWLIDMVRVGLPDFQIPERLLPVPAPTHLAMPVLDL